MLESESAINAVLLVYLVIFALFGMAASYFVQFIYTYWVKKRSEPKYLLRAGGCVLVITLLAFLLTLFGF